MATATKEYMKDGVLYRNDRRGARRPRSCVHSFNIFFEFVDLGDFESYEILGHRDQGPIVKAGG